MLDLVVRGGRVVDGTGRPAVRADVGVTGGRIVGVGQVDGEARDTIDADGLVVTPGFIDVHTHYDAQAFWDTSLSPSPLHGVTTVVGGNCGFSIAPLEPGGDAYIMRMLARVEGMPLESLTAGDPWDWRSTGDFLDRLEGRLTPNTGWLVGHSTLRYAVMGPDALERAATPDEIARMAAHLRAGLRAGALGFSSSWAPTHNDHEGRPVASRQAREDELLHLCRVTGEHPGTSIEFVPSAGRFTDEIIDLVARMSAAAGRPLNWNSLIVEDTGDDDIAHQLSADDLAATMGGQVMALTPPASRHNRLNLRSGMILDALPGWDGLFTKPVDERRRMLADPEVRARFADSAAAATGALAKYANWGSYQVVETFVPETAAASGRTVGDLAAERGAAPFDVLCEIAVADDLRTVIMRSTPEDDGLWERRLRTWRDPRAMVGASDAGAHLDMSDAFSFATTMLRDAVRERGLLPLEEAVSMLTDAPARLYGLRDRGQVRPGAWADLVVFDPDTVGASPVRTVDDLPGGASRLFADAIGVEHVFVAGRRAVDHGVVTDARAGQVLRSGRDTDSVDTTGRGRPA